MTACLIICFTTFRSLLFSFVMLRRKVFFYISRNERLIIKFWIGYNSVSEIFPYNFLYKLTTFKLKKTGKEERRSGILPNLSWFVFRSVVPLGTYISLEIVIIKCGTQSSVVDLFLTRELKQILVSSGKTKRFSFSMKWSIQSYEKSNWKLQTNDQWLGNWGPQVSLIGVNYGLFLHFDASKLKWWFISYEFESQNYLN